MHKISILMQIEQDIRTILETAYLVIKSKYLRQEKRSPRNIHKYFSFKLKKKLVLKEKTEKFYQKTITSSEANFFYIELIYM